jgi:hypothetical protein
MFVSFVQLLIYIYFTFVVDTELIPEELLEPVVFHKLPGPLVSKWNVKRTLGNYVVVTVKEATAYPALISKKDAQVIMIGKRLYYVIIITHYYTM